MLNVDDAFVRSLIDTIYSAALAPDRWISVLDKVRHSLNGVALNFFVPNSFALGGDLLNVGVDPSGQKRYMEHYSNLDPLRTHVPKMVPGQILHSDDIVSRDLLVKSEFYNDWLRHQQFWNALVATADMDGHNGTLLVTRPQTSSEFSGEDVRLLGVLAPHLSRALAVSYRLASANGLAKSLQALIDSHEGAVLLIDKQGIIRYANAEAERLLATADGLFSSRGKFTARNPAEAASVELMLARPTQTPIVVVSRPSGNAPYILKAIPIPQSERYGSEPPATGVFITDPEIIRKTDVILRQAYGLTETEAMIAGSLGHGKSPKRIAEALCISVGTVRWHLKHVFEKVGVNRQGELASLVMRLSQPI